ncbi:VOC family protein [Undibacterium terreum]|uniref:VOC family protein n=1 Tax=Undibacterium terreum TaxID=1224302 RepID=UPI001E4D8357|nr:VOC family protein [Undibacterium terreum]
MPSLKKTFKTHISYAESALPAPIQKLDRVCPLVQAKSLAFLMFEKPDLGAVENFLIDFGMHTVVLTEDQLVMRGSSSEPCIYVARRGPRSRYIGAAFNVSNENDLLVLQSQAGARRLPTEIIPGGGVGVELIDPAGNLLWLVTGRKQVNPIPVRTPLHPLTNGPGTIGRVNKTVRAPLEPAAVVKLGHVVLQTVDFQGMARWYMRHLGVIPSDVQFLADGSPNLCFFRLNLGSTPADHHSLVLVGGLEEKYEHSAYEVVDLDALGQGHNILRANGHRHMWGIGRHIQGSQLFDYWFDPNGMEFEHYTDGDVFTADYEPQYSPLDLSGIWAWGDDVPKSMGPQHNLSTLIKILKLLCNRRLSMERLKLLGSALSAPPRPWL